MKIASANSAEQMAHQIKDDNDKFAMPVKDAKVTIEWRAPRRRALTATQPAPGRSAPPPADRRRGRAAGDAGQAQELGALGLPPLLMRYLCATNIIENPNGIVRTTTNRAKCWRDQDMALRWVAAGFLEAEKSFRRIGGVKGPWVLAVALGRELLQRQVKRAA